MKFGKYSVLLCSVVLAANVSAASSESSKCDYSWGYSSASRSCSYDPAYPVVTESGTCIFVELAHLTCWEEDAVDKGKANFHVHWNYLTQCPYNDNGTIKYSDSKYSG